MRRRRRDAVVRMGILATRVLLWLRFPRLARRTLEATSRAFLQAVRS